MIVNWYREHAKKFNEAANYIEGTFAAGQPRIRTNGASLRLRNQPEFTAANVQAAVKKRGMRRADVANAFQVPIEEVEALIEDKKNGLVVAERAGWIRTKE